MPETTEDQFRAQALAFLEANASRRQEEKGLEWGKGSDEVGMFERTSREKELAEVGDAKAWRQKKFDAGFGWVTGPTQYGGRAFPASYDRVYSQLEQEFTVPNQGCFGIGLGMVAPTILAHATEPAKELYLRRLWRGEIVGCQLFSEPGAGSDLASLQTKAERDGDEWVITGQKVWTSGAHYSDVGEVICRTDPNLPKHKGLTGFLVDMHAPGVEIRPLRQMTGSANFNEVFFNEVKVPADHLLGDVNQGWTVALTTLMNERASIGTGGNSGRASAMSTARLAALLRSQGLDDDPVLRQKLVEIHIHGKVAQFTNLRALAKIRGGQTPGPEMSISKMALVSQMQRVGAFVSSVLGPKLVADSGEWGTYAWGDFLVGTPGMRIAGGSDEVMRNIVGERVLGLPKEPGIDSVTPFNELKVGTQKG